jgi:crotonobetainyl-CoA:carnitine CoA-transferase CaiB-like acyl-CoA transferase
MNSAAAPLLPGALDGVVVLDLSRILAGPWCTQTLADLGAEVIKVERPGRGDDTRTFGPPFLKDRDGVETTDAAYYLAANRNKRSVTIDIATPEGQALVHKLADRAHVVIENYKVGDMARYGLDAASLRRTRPHLVYCSITGFGQTGPYRFRAGYDYAAQAMGGLMSVTGERDDLPGGGPQKAGVAVADLFTGMYATVAILAALRHAEATGQGQDIDMALLDSQVAMLANLSAVYLVTGKAPGRYGNAHQNLVPYQVFEAADGHIVLAVGNDEQFRRCCAVLGDAALGLDPRFAKAPDRVRNRGVLVPTMARLFKRQTKAHWLAALEEATVPCGPINNLAEVFEDPQVQARQMRVPVPHALTDTLQLVASPMKLSATPVQVRRGPPLLGEHTDEVLAELGLNAQEVAALRQRGVV